MCRLLPESQIISPEEDTSPEPTVMRFSFGTDAMRSKNAIAPLTKPPFEHMTRYTGSDLLFVNRASIASNTLDVFSSPTGPIQVTILFGFIFYLAFCFDGASQDLRYHGGLFRSIFKKRKAHTNV